MPINRVTIVGNLTRDPELRGLPSGGSVCSLRVAVNERRKAQDGTWTDAPNFFNVTIFGNSADNAARYLAKGRQVAVDGRLRWREWQDQNGNKREAVEIVAQDVQFIGPREGGGGGGQSGGYGGGQQGGDDWGGGQQSGGGGGGWSAPPAQQSGPPAGGGYVDQGDFGGPPAGGGAPPQQRPPAGPPPADDDIPF
ncbi:MAG: single-stranded DNA-binding protein [Solirubrobacteraceae bacterium]|nr:single-stranded DNA-binding protein [Solirubrobacteraceae bacterium]